MDRSSGGEVGNHRHRVQNRSGKDGTVPDQVKIFDALAEGIE
jgi:hypothetical protein